MSRTREQSSRRIFYGLLAGTFTIGLALSGQNREDAAFSKTYDEYTSDKTTNPEGDLLLKGFNAKAASNFKLCYDKINEAANHLSNEKPKDAISFEAQKALTKKCAFSR